MKTKKRTKRILRLADKPFFIPEKAAAHFAQTKQHGKGKTTAWLMRKFNAQKHFPNWQRN
ncbi:MAG: hypothetical protein R3C26_18620 [Calditrichia bacterium]